MSRTVNEKHLLQKLRRDVNGKVLADDYGVGRSNISNIIKKYEHITMYVCSQFNVSNAYLDA